MKLCIVVPCYNEEAVLNITAEKLKQCLAELEKKEKIEPGSRVVFVDDGSSDSTWKLISGLSCGRVFDGIKLSRNCGHQNALLAGLLTVKDGFDAVISMDADLQDDISAVEKMVDEYKNGADIVYGVRSSRKKDSLFKRTSAAAFYKLMDSSTVYNHADFRLMSRRALDALSEFSEVNLFLRGIVPMIGLKTATVYYERGERAAGESKYPLKKMLSLAFEGITSLSIKPIQIIIKLGFILSLIGVGIIIYSLIQHFLDNTNAGWTSIFASIWMLDGLQLIAIGVIGKYIGKIYLETKRRPRYIIEKNTMDEKNLPQ